MNPKEKLSPETEKIIVEVLGGKYAYLPLPNLISILNRLLRNPAEITKLVESRDVQTLVSLILSENMPDIGFRDCVARLYTAYKEISRGEQYTLIGKLEELTNSIHIKPYST